MLQNVISNIGLDYIANLCYDQCKDLSDLDKAILLSKADFSCYNSIELNCYQQLVNTLNRKRGTESNSVVNVEQDGLQEFYINNPRCSNFDVWEIVTNNIRMKYKAVATVCTISKKQPNLITTLTTLDNSVKIIQTIEKICKNIKGGVCVENDEKNLNFEYNVLKRSSDNCNLELTEYKYLASKGLTIDAAKSIYGQNLALSIDRSKQLVIKLESEYFVLEDLDCDRSGTVVEAPED